MNRLRKIYLVVILVYLFLAGCVRILTTSPSLLPMTDTNITTVSPSVGSSPLEGDTVRSWNTGPVIAFIARRSVECFYCWFSAPPEAILYADGRQIIGYESRLYERRFSNLEMCALLNKIEKSGYFQYTTEQYQQFYQSNHLKLSGEYYRFSVDSWRENSLTLQGFGFMYWQYKDKVEWPVAIKVPYEELTTYDPNSMQIYVPERVAIHIELDPDLEIQLGTWGIESPVLSDLIARYADQATPISETSEGEMILFGDEARAVLKPFNDRPWGGKKIFVVNNTRYLVAVRVLLPFEASGGRDSSYPLIPDPNTKFPQTPMTCPK